MPRFIAVFSRNSDLAHALSLARTLSPRIEICPPSGLLFKTTSRSERQILEKLLEATAGQSLKAAAASTRMIALLAAAREAGKENSQRSGEALWAGGPAEGGSAAHRAATTMPPCLLSDAPSGLWRQVAKPITVVPPGRERDFLAPLPLKLFSLIIDESYHPHFRTLSKWGIRTLGELAQLPDTELAARLGPSGIRLQKMARGEDVGLFQVDEEVPVFKESEELEWTLDSLEPLAFILGGILERLCNRLQSYGKAAEALHIALNLDNQICYRRTLRLAFPMRNPKTLLSLLRLELQSHPPNAGIVGVTLETIPAPNRVIQYSLLDASALNPEKLARTLARLQATLGDANIGSPVLLDTHRPDSFEVQGNMGTAPLFPHFAREMRKQGGCPHISRSQGSSAHGANAALALRRIRPPKPIRIHSDQIVVCSGPWRTSGDWWKGPSHQWSRDEWDVEFLDGSLCRIYWDRQEKNWYLEGIYD